MSMNMQQNAIYESLRAMEKVYVQLVNYTNGIKQQEKENGKGKGKSGAQGEKGGRKERRRAATARSTGKTGSNAGNKGGENRKPRAGSTGHFPSTGHSPSAGDAPSGGSSHGRGRKRTAEGDPERRTGGGAAADGDARGRKRGSGLSHRGRSVRHVPDRADGRRRLFGRSARGARAAAV